MLRATRHNPVMTALDIALTVPFFVALLALALIDARSFRLPDAITLPLIPAGLVAAFLIDAPIWLHALGAALGYGGLVAIEIAYRAWRGRDGLGRGDAKLLAAGGAWCGAAALPATLLIASVSALLFVLLISAIRRRAPTGETMLAFGPFLAFGVGLVWILQRTGLSAAAGF